MPADLAATIDRLEAVEAITKLKHIYMNLCDLGYPPEHLGPLFTEDAVWESEIFGRHEGRPAIETFFGGVSSSIVFAAHLALNGVIDVQGDAATGRWRLLMPCTIQEDGAPVSRWMLGDYQERYVRIDGAWLIQSLDVFMNFNIRWDEAWAQVAAARL
ncbi:MAG: nuclear transport factor 2 family protein [Planctomycetota bacterium]